MERDHAEAEMIRHAEEENRRVKEHEMQLHTERLRAQQEAAQQDQAAVYAAKLQLARVQAVLLASISPDEKGTEVHMVDSDEDDDPRSPAAGGDWWDDEVDFTKVAQSTVHD